MKCWKYFFNGGGRQLWGKAEVHLHIVLTWPGEKVWISWNWYFPRACAMCIYCTIVCEQLQSFSCWLEVVSLFRSIPFPETELSEKNEVNHELTGSDANTRPVHSSFTWLGVQRKILVWIIGVVLGQMVWSTSIMCSKVDVLLCRWCTHEWKKPMRSLKAWCKTRILTWGKVACIQ